MKTATAVKRVDTTKLSVVGVKSPEKKTGQAMVDELMIRLTGAPFALRVAGYKIALYLPRGDEKIGSIIKPEAYRDNEVLKACCGLVIALGPDAYSPKERYPSGPWCAVGDWVGFQRYETTAALIGYRGQTIALIPDDKIDGVVPEREYLTDILKRDLM